MSHRVLKLANGHTMPQMGLGTLFLKDVKAIEHAITKVGYRHIDTASITMNEKEVGTAVNNAIDHGGLTRDELFVTTKIWHNQYQDPEAALKKSLSQLKLDSVDMYVIHWPNNFFSNPQVPMHMLWQDMERLVDQGLTQSIGLSNFNIQLTADLLTYARHKPVYNQVQINPYNTQADAVAFMLANNIAPVASSPLGRLASKMGPKGTSDVTKEAVV